MSKTRMFGRIATLALVMALGGAGGCSGDDYYCDATGCYYCDGVGCRPVAATPSPTGAGCQFNSQCGAGRVCINQACQAACTTDAECPAGQACRNNVCADRPTGECSTDAQCGADRRCVNTTCRARCSASAAASCGAGLYCSDQGVCVPDTRRRPFCMTDAQCEAGSRCIDGVCRRPCAVVNDCLRTSATYRNCAPISYLPAAGSFCLTDNEYRPNCSAAAMCTAGQACVDGVCRSY
ncbi:MAG: hypothetical protein HY909_14960 [Deltaproteobacteria bacterium]|nr:hypothetical protein [Deltaproteobacteria bacterium]